MTSGSRAPEPAPVEHRDGDPRYGAVDLIVVGGGPRAVAIVGRLAARLRPHTGYGGPAGPEAMRVAIIDDVQVGAGGTWHTEQHPLLLNNTYSAHTTAHADESTDQDGPLVPGPDLVQWAASVRAAGDADRHLRRIGPPRPDWVAGEVRRLLPESYPTRRLQGVYYREQLAEAAHRGGVRVRHILGQAVDLLCEGGARTVRLRGGHLVGWDGPGGHRLVEPEPVEAVRAPLVVLAQGMIQARRSASTERFVEQAARRGLTYLEPGMPAARDWDRVPGEGAAVIVAGLGANFFDVIGILTAGRGGRFVDASSGADRDRCGQSTDDGGAGGPAAGAPLRYLPSGREPRLLVGSRRGLPYRGKGAYPAQTRGFPPPWVPRIATMGAMREAAGGGVVDFTAQVWTLITRELALAHVLTLAAHRPESVRAGLTEDAAVAALASADDVPAAMARLLRHPRYGVDLERLDRPDPAGDLPQWRAWVQRWTLEEQASIADPLTSPRNAVNRAMNTLRGQVGKLVAAGLIDGAALMADFEGWFAPRGLAMSSGPPPRRTAQLLALVRAGVVELLGEDLRVEVDEEFIARSRVHPGGRRARAFIETRMSKGRVPGTDDPLLGALLASGRAGIHHRPTRGAAGLVPTTSLDVDPHTFQLLDAGGRPDAQVLVLGIPAEALQPGSAIGATPGKASPLLAGADRAAASALQHGIEYARTSTPSTAGAR